MRLIEAGDLLVLAVLLPAWIAFGLADWHQHRRTRIELTSGWRESAFHLLLIGQGALAVLLGLFFELNALVLAVALTIFVVHEVTASVDVAFASSRRDVTPAEQRIHHYLTALPLAVLAVTFATHADRDSMSAWTLDWKASPLPAWYVVPFLALSSLNALAFAEEFVRCARIAAKPAA